MQTDGGLLGVRSKELVQRRKRSGCRTSKRMRLEGETYMCYILIINEIHEIMSDSRDRGKGREMSMTKTRSSEMFGVKMEISFPKRRSFENFIGENLFVHSKLGARSPPMPFAIIQSSIICPGIPLDLFPNIFLSFTVLIVIIL